MQNLEQYGTRKGTIIMGCTVFLCLIIGLIAIITTEPGRVDVHAGDWVIVRANCETGQISVRDRCPPYETKVVTINVRWVNAQARMEVCRDVTQVYPNLTATLVVDGEGGYTWEDRVGCCGPCPKPALSPRDTIP